MKDYLNSNKTTKFQYGGPFKKPDSTKPVPAKSAFEMFNLDSREGAKLSEDDKKQILDNYLKEQNNKGQEAYQKEHDANPLRKKFSKLQQGISELPWYSRIPAQIVTSPATAGYELSKMVNPSMMNNMSEEEAAKTITNAGFAVGDSFALGKGISALGAIKNLKAPATKIILDKKNAFGRFPWQQARRDAAKILGIEGTKELTEDSLQDYINTTLGNKED